MKNEFEGLVERLLAGGVSLDDAIELLERSMIAGALARNKGNHSAASKQLGIHRNTLQRKAIQFELDNGRTRPRRKPISKEVRARKRKAAIA